MAQMIPLEHPGIILKEEFLDPMELTNYKVSKGTGISETALGEIINGKRGISPINGLRLAKFFGMSDDFFIKIQMQYEIDKAKKKESKKLDRIVQFVPKQERLIEA